MKKTMYATASVRVRSSYSTGSEVLAGLAQGEKIEVTGESENGWMRVNYKGHTGYVSKDYLTETAPKTNQSQGTQTNQNNQNSHSSATTTTGKPTGPGGGTGSTGGGATAGNNSPGGAAGPGGGTGTTSNNNTGPGGSSNQGGTVSPGGNTSPGGSGNSSTTGSSNSGGNSVTGSVTSLDPSGVTIQTTGGTTYQFVWGDSVPALAPGEKIQIFYETTSSGEKRVTNYSK